VPNDLPSTPYVPAHFDWLQHLAERFSSFVDTLSLQFSTVLGAWSRQPLLFGITPAKILLGLLVLALGLALAGIVRLLIWKLLSLSPVPIDHRALLAQRHPVCGPPGADRVFHFHRCLFRRLLVAVIAALGLGALLMTFPPVRQLGTGLLASAGVAGVIAGFAAQKSLGMIIGGLQLAITEPLRLNDEIIIEGEWGVVEEITLTYVVVRTWDQRSLVVPITYFLEKSFQNWTRHSPDLIGVVFLYVDFLVPLDDCARKPSASCTRRNAGMAGCSRSRLPISKPDCVEIRILASALNASVTFDLRCEIREQLLSFLQARYPGAFRRLRTSWSRSSAGQLAGTAAGQTSGPSFRTAHQ
jgi:small-conductance mechanosensitive channel